ncbi:hypothetical protein SLEP1_g41511 [Rubroshorea leprosula]|uniref:Uncharacterized protein n=1 Tax=Rubroshorea leprosula TaxID=152421 RepID=A0AAV5L7P0_9ROSI|nr:hypothetical protein SLEP1_g41511 [Rubroshorea leprosula]
MKSTSVWKEKYKASSKMSLGEKVCRFISGANENQMNSSLCNMMANKVTIKLNVFSEFMEDIIMSNLHGTLIVKIRLVAGG